MAYCYENGFLISEFLEKLIIRNRAGKEGNYGR